jgi:hypothetical protein
MVPLQGTRREEEDSATYGCGGYAALAIGYFITPLQGFLRLRRYFVSNSKCRNLNDLSIHLTDEPKKRSRHHDVSFSYYLILIILYAYV